MAFMSAVTMTLDASGNFGSARPCRLGGETFAVQVGNPKSGVPGWFPPPGRPFRCSIPITTNGITEGILTFDPTGLSASNLAAWKKAFSGGKTVIVTMTIAGGALGTEDLTVNLADASTVVVAAAQVVTSAANLGASVVNFVAVLFRALFRVVTPGPAQTELLTETHQSVK